LSIETHFLPSFNGFEQVDWVRQEPEFCDP